MAHEIKRWNARCVRAERRGEHRAGRGLGGGCPGKACPWRAPSSKTLEVVRERAVEMAEGRAFQAEGTASAEASGVSEAGAWRRVRLSF